MTLITLFFQSSITEINHWKIDLCNHCISIDDERMEVGVAFEGSPNIKEIPNFCGQLRETVSSVDIISTQNITVSVAICDSSVFPKKFLLCHSFGLSSFIFGNLVETETFLLHEIITPCFRKSEEDIFEETKLLSEFSQKFQENNLSVEFEHDKKEFSIFLPYIQQNEPSIIVSTIRYEAIRNIVFHRTPYEVQLFFHIRHPPKIRKCFKREDVDRWIYSRITSWGDSIERGRRRYSIAQSPWILLQFSSINVGHFYIIIQTNYLFAES